MEFMEHLQNLGLIIAYISAFGAGVAMVMLLIGLVGRIIE